MKVVFDVLVLMAFVGFGAALVYGLEIAGLQRFLTRIGYQDADGVVIEADGVSVRHTHPPITDSNG